MHSIKHEWLEAAVLFAVQHQEHLAVSYSEIVTQINSAPTKKASLTDWTSCKRAVTKKDNTLQAVSLSGLERR